MHCACDEMRIQGWKLELLNYVYVLSDLKINRTFISLYGESHVPTAKRL